MARQTIIEILDDLDGSPAESSVTFGVDGIQYEIDLSAANHERFVAAMAPYVAVAQLVGKLGGFKGGVTRGARTVKPNGNGADREKSRAARAWWGGLSAAERAGLGLPESLSDRGRVPAVIVTAFDAVKDGLIQPVATTPEQAPEVTAEATAPAPKARTRKAPQAKADTAVARLVPFLAPPAPTAPKKSTSRSRKADAKTAK